MARKGVLATGYLYPVLVAALSLASFALAYLFLLDLRPCGPTRQVGCLDQATYFGFEGVVYALLALVAWRAVSRARRGKEMWTMRVYWPSVLGAFAVLGVIAYVVTIVPRRGCDVGAWYVAWGCWDPGVTALRVTVALVLTGLFAFGMALAADAVGEAPAREESPDDAGTAPAEADEEIPAR